MQYPASHVATTILLLFQNGLRSNLRASDFFWGSMPPDPLVLLFMHAYIHMIHPCNPPPPRLNILATGLTFDHNSSYSSYIAVV